MSPWSKIWKHCARLKLKIFIDSKDSLIFARHGKSIGKSWERENRSKKSYQNFKENLCPLGQNLEALCTFKIEDFYRFWRVLDICETWKELRERKSNVEKKIIPKWLGEKSRRFSPTSILMHAYNTCFVSRIQKKRNGVIEIRRMTRIFPVKIFIGYPQIFCRLCAFQHLMK